MALSFNQQDGGPGMMISDLGAATNLRHPRYYRWSEDSRKLEHTPSPSNALKVQVRQAQARLALEDWRIRREALQSETKKPQNENHRIGSRRAKR